MKLKVKTLYGTSSVAFRICLKANLQALISHDKISQTQQHEIVHFVKVHCQVFLTPLLESSWVRLGHIIMESSFSLLILCTSPDSPLKATTLKTNRSFYCCFESKSSFFKWFGHISEFSSVGK